MVPFRPTCFGARATDTRMGSGQKLGKRPGRFALAFRSCAQCALIGPKSMLGEGPGWADCRTPGCERRPGKIELAGAQADDRKRVTHNLVIGRHFRSLLARNLGTRDRTRTTGMARKIIYAAGGIVVRAGARRRFAVVQRSKDERWVLPRGKLKRNESPIVAARREATEETGFRVHVREFLGAITYRASGRSKIVQFWRMDAAARPSREVTKDIVAIQWLPFAKAVRRLSYPLEKLFLAGVGRRALLRPRRHARRRMRRRVARGRPRSSPRTSKVGRR